jgi:hypothetical protein
MQPLADVRRVGRVRAIFLKTTTRYFHSILLGLRS